MKLYKYLYTRYALEFLRTKELKVATLHDANDPEEWMPCFLNDAGQNWLDDPVNRAAWENHYSSKYGLISFSELPDNTLMWAHYGDKFRGIALEFETKISLTDSRLTEVTYPPSNSRLMLDMDCIRHANDETVKNLVGRKSAVWEYEKEWRLLVSIDECKYVGSIDGRPVLTHPVDGVIDFCGLVLGSRCLLTETQAMTELEKWQDRDVAIHRIVPDGKTFSYRVQHAVTLPKADQR